jgi:hypothetical protein
MNEVNSALYYESASDIKNRVCVDRPQFLLYLHNGTGQTLHWRFSEDVGKRGLKNVHTSGLLSAGLEARDNSAHTPP